MKTYCIKGKTNGYIASRDVDFKGKTEVVFESGLTLREAQKMLLEWANRDLDCSYNNWGLLCCNHHEAGSWSDGTRYYDYDSRCFFIEEEEVEE